MAKIELIEMDLNKAKESLVQFTEICELTKKTCISVPKFYEALIFINGKQMFKMGQCVQRNILQDSGKEYLGAEVQAAFYSKSFKAEMLFGFGGINVNNERLKEAYQVGVNGQITFKVVNFANLIRSFAFEDKITADNIREKILPIVKSVGMTIVGKCFSNTNVSVFEIDSKIGDIRQEMYDELASENALKQLGVEIDSIAINKVHVPQEDLDVIRQRINN